MVRTVALQMLASVIFLPCLLDIACAYETDKTISKACSEEPHRIRYKCYAAQVFQGSSGVQSRGRVLKQGLPPVFDYEVDNGYEPKSKQRGSSDVTTYENTYDAKDDANSNIKQAMSNKDFKTSQRKNETMLEVEKDWIVVWDESQVSSQDIHRVCASGLAGMNKTCQREFSTAVTGFSARLTLSELEGVLSEHSAQIKYAERDQVFEAAMATQTTNVPWGLDRIDSRSGLSGSYQYLNTGEGVSVYVIDTGVRVTHEQFEYLNGSAGTRAQSGYDFIDDDRNADDCTGHGTHVAGIAAGKDIGVAKGARVHSVRVLDCYGIGSTQAVVAGIDWTETNHIKPAVATISLSGPASVALDEATAALVAAGVTVTVPAGNNRWDACSNSPAREPTAVTVGASDEQDGAASFTNYGSCVDLFAPGTNALSADYGSDTISSTRSGTSMAAPYVLGVMALYLQSNPGARPSEVSAEILNYTTKHVLTGLGASSPNKLLYSFVYPLTSAPTSPTATPTASPTSPTTSPTAAPTSPTLSPTTNAPTTRDPVRDAVSSFISFAPSIVGGMSSLYDFTDGITGTCIDDGGNDMYDCGNSIYIKRPGVNSYVGPLSYRQSTSESSTGAGDISYSTYKSITPGSFVWLAMFYSPASMIDGVKIDGGNGADGRGSATWGALGVSSADSRFYGWYKSVAGAGDPSINQLIIAPGSSWTQSASSNTDSDLHTLTGNGTSASRVYYLLWAGRGGYSYSTDDFRTAMNAFVEAIGSTSSPTTIAPTSTLSPTSPTASPTASPTSPTASPTASAPASCAEYMFWGYNVSGVYTIGAKPGSSLPERSVFCDMKEDGGGWMLLYSYNRNVTTGDRIMDSAQLPTSPTTGYSHWHLGPALGYTSTDDVVDVRFFCRTSRHSRVMHFKTSNQHIRGVAVSGTHGESNSVQYWNSGWTSLSNHNAYLPADVSFVSSNGGFDAYPFQGNNVAWVINSFSAYCDDYGGAGSSTHQVWVRLAGPTLAPTSAPTSPTTVPTAAPTSPTTSPTGAPTSKSTSPTTITPSSCAEYMSLGDTTSGLYTISAKNGSGLPDQRIYCDMDEDGGGWMLLYSYNRRFTTDKPLNSSHLPTSPTTGFSHWHLGPALGYTSADDVVDVRFYCSHSSHARILHFKTSNQHVRRVAVSGSHGGANSPTHWTSGWTALSGHTAYLPASTTTTSNSGDFTRAPFRGNNVRWAIYGSTSYCDDYGRPGDSSHQIWVRLPGPTKAPTSAPTSASANRTATPILLTAAPTSGGGPPTSVTVFPTASSSAVVHSTCIEYMLMGHPSGVYTISAKNGSGLPHQSVYCDMDEDGGGWMLLYSYNRNLTTNRALNDTTLPTSPNTGYSHWHLGPALGYTSADDVVGVRFYCSTDYHPRVMHFKTSDRHVRQVAVSGSHDGGNLPTSWTSGWTTLPGHTAYLPGSATSASNNGAFFDLPFYGNGGYWSISSRSTYCDDFGRPDSSSHQVWVRLPAPPTFSPTTSSPTGHPTSSPTTLSPTSNPTTSLPTNHPTTASPTNHPTTASPTNHPTTASPTIHPTTSSPTTDSTPTGELRDQPLKDNWFRKREMARRDAFPQVYSWFRKQAKNNSARDVAASSNAEQAFQ